MFKSVGVFLLPVYFICVAQKGNPVWGTRQGDGCWEQNSLASYLIETEEGQPWGEEFMERDFSR